MKTQTVVVYPETGARGDAAADVPLREYDFLYVRQIPDWSREDPGDAGRGVPVPGDVRAAQGGAARAPSIERAGGYTTGAYVKAGVFTRVSTRKTQQEAIDKMIEELETSIAQKGAGRWAPRSTRRTSSRTGSWSRPAAPSSPS